MVGLIETRPRFETKYEEVVTKHPDVKLKDTNGWSDLSKTLRDSDEREGKEVKENVDTILVFVSTFCSSPSELCSGSNLVGIVLCRHHNSRHRVNQAFTKGPSRGHDNNSSSHLATTRFLRRDR